jgi:hypothetical protein
MKFTAPTHTPPDKQLQSQKQNIQTEKLYNNIKIQHSIGSIWNEKRKSLYEFQKLGQKMGD